MASVFTFYVIIDRIRGSHPAIQEAFANSDDVLSDETLAKLRAANEPVPTDADAVAAHQTLLRYMRNDFSKGIRFAQDIGRRFFSDDVSFRQDLDTRTLMDNYRSPLQ